MAKKQLVTIGVSILIYFSLQEHLINLFDQYVVDFLLSKFADETFGIIRLIIYAALIAGLAWTIWKKCWEESYQPSLVFHFIVCFICFCYWWERTDRQHYCFHKLFTFGSLTIFQLDPIYSILSVAAVLVFRNYSVNRNFLEGNTFLKQDHPLSAIGKDLIDRTTFYNKMIARIKDIGFDTEKSFAIGINSVWGYGKTSLLNIIKEGIHKEKNIVCIDYNPWLSGDKKSLTYDLFSVIEKQLSKHVSNTNILLDYARRVSKVDNDDNKFKGFADIFEDDETLRDRFDEIAELIKITGKRFIIFIDDLDRLDNDEVFEVLRLIRNVANFPRLLYIVAYDKYYLVNALKIKHIYKPQQYLEKIFELELELPKIDGLKLKQLCYNIIREGLGRIDVIPADRSRIETQVNELIFNISQLTNGKQAEAAKYFNSVFKSVRDIMKFSNSFLLTLSLNKDDLYVPDLYLLEIIKVVNADLYHLMASTSKYLTINSTGTRQEYSLYITPTSTTSTVASGDFEIASRIKQSYQLDLIKALFSIPGAADFKHEKTIVYVDNFKTYFIFAEP